MSKSGVQGLGFRAQGLGLDVWSSGYHGEFKFGIRGLRLKV